MTLQWYDLGVDLVMMIEERLVLYIDKVRFRGVCKSWNSIPPKMPNLQVKQIPWLFHQVYDNAEASHGLFDPHENKLYLLDLPEVEQEEEEGMSLIGSSRGWVAHFYDIGPDSTPCIFLLNPLTRYEVKLPSLNKFYNHHKLDIDDDYLYSEFVDKIVLSSSPINYDCEVFVMFNNRSLAYCKPNDEKWSYINLGKRKTDDIMFHKGKLHALLCGGELLVLENINPTRFKRIASKQSTITTSSCNRYLVESSDGELMMVVPEISRCYGGSQQRVDCSGKTPRFKVYKHDSTNLRWYMVKSIGDEVIFVGDTSSMSISCRDWPGFKGNQIYFSKTLCPYHYSLDVDIGVFNLDDESSESLSGFRHKYVWLFPPAWFTPSFI